MNLRRTWPDLALAAPVVLVGLWEWAPAGHALPNAAVVVLAALAAGLCRRQPAWALAVIWLAAIVQVAAGRGFGPLEVAVLIVAFGTARYGSRLTVWASALSIPAGAVIALAYALDHADSFPEAQAVAALVRITGVDVVGGLVVILGVLGAPWTAGLLLRVQDRSRRAEAEHRVEQARTAAAAQSQAAQTRLTREVHDVVGHSLAVIIAQADAARFAAAQGDSAEQGDPVVHEALERIAAVGRSSLAEVRDVLSRTQDDGADHGSVPDLADLVAGVRSAGNAVTESVTGTPVTLDAATGAAAYRVLQELLTNALKHGDPAASIEVDQVWTAGGLTLRVSNLVASDTADAPRGMGLTGVQARVDAVGGTVRTSLVQDRFTATAYLPHDAVTS